MSLISPENLGSCPTCGCLVLVAHVAILGREWTLVWDPCTADRWKVERMLSRADVARQGFGLIRGDHHECPPNEECALWIYQRQREGRREGEVPR